ncbi:MAG: hypothetical protein WCG23_11305 [bacterium]
MVEASNNFYTYKQLEGIFNTADSVVRKKVEKYQFNTDKKFVNGRKQIVVFLSDEEISEIRHEIEENKKIFGSKKAEVNHLKSDEIPISRQPENIVNKDIEPQQQPDLIKLIFNEVDKIHKSYKDEIVNVSLQNKLLIDSEKRKEDEYLRQISEFKAENIQLKTDNESLKKEIEHLKQKTFFGIKLR